MSVWTKTAPRVRTPWFRNGEKPVRIGRYEWLGHVAGVERVFTVFWDGEDFRRPGTGETGEVQDMWLLLEQNIVWRGLEAA